MEEGKQVSTVDIIRKLRMQRGGMVQHPEQAEFTQLCLDMYAKHLNAKQPAQLSKGAPPAVSGTPAIVSKAKVGTGSQANDVHDVTLEAIARAESRIPRTMGLHHSQRDVDEGAHDRVPTWRVQQLNKRRKETDEEISQHRSAVRSRGGRAPPAIRR
jgi:hypothetical protein